MLRRQETKSIERWLTLTTLLLAMAVPVAGRAEADMHSDAPQGVGGISNDELEDMSLEELMAIDIEVASKKAERPSDAPGVITVVTKEEIAHFGAISLVDVLNRVTSIQMMSSHLWVQAKPVVRGDLITHADNHTLILINGRPVRDAYEGNSQFIFYAAFPVDLIERLEIIRGPGAVLHGSNAISAVINIVTQKPGKDGVYMKASAGGGSFGGIMGQAVATVQDGPGELVVGANYFEEDGWTYAPTTNFPNPAIGQEQGSLGYAEINRSVWASYKHKGFFCQVFYGRSVQENLGIVPAWFNQGTVGGRRLFVDLGYTHKVNEKWSVLVNLTRNGYRKHLTDHTGDNIDFSDATVAELSTRIGLGESTNLAVGVLTEIRENRDIPVFLANVQKPGVGKKYRENLYSAYAQFDTRPLPQLKLIAGAQLNHTHKGHTDVVPRLGAIYDLSKQLTVKLLAGQAFRVASPLEEYMAIPNVLFGNENLSPEKVTTYDAQVMYNVKRSEFVLSLFRSSYSDLVERYGVDGDPTQYLRNGGRTTIQGAELEARTKLIDGFYARGSFTYQKELDDTLYIAPFMAKVGLSYSAGPITAGVFYSHFATPEKEVEPLGGLELNPPATDIGLLSVNLTAKFDVGIPLMVNLYGTNLLDNAMNYPEFSKGWVNTLPIGPGRAFYGRVGFEF